MLAIDRLGYLEMNNRTGFEEGKVVSLVSFQVFLSFWFYFFTFPPIHHTQVGLFQKKIRTPLFRISTSLDIRNFFLTTLNTRVDIFISFNPPWYFRTLPGYFSCRPPWISDILNRRGGGGYGLFLEKPVELSFKVFFKFSLLSPFHNLFYQTVTFISLICFLFHHNDAQGPCYSGTRSGMLIPRPGFNSHWVPNTTWCWP